MKKAILVLFVLGFVGMNGYAQKVYKGTDNNVYLECTVASGMPAGSVTTTAKCKDGKALYDKYRDGSTTMNPYAAENDEVFEKLEIDNADMAKPGALTTFTMDWVTAYDGCKKKSAGWRLPTQRELMLMYIFREPLNQLIVDKFVSSYYWSSSEYTSNYSWYVNFSNGNTFIDSKPSSNRVRCVREVTL